ncbi:MAG: hypothetical protein M1819_003077 [Sarea resinae]|nr:MAG: hypothetical protein M1819_003077 [Sarea resinae]
MAPLKRTRVVQDDDSSEVIDAESARSSKKQDARKKARLTETPSQRRSRDDEADDIADEALPVTNGTKENEEDDYGQRRDAGFADLADEDADTQRATQHIQQRNKKSMENRPADNGIIEAVTCINFMCHSKLHVQLGPLINFIIGHNGSGKSAVLTALTLCLGGKAASTNRGQSLKNFIKEGQESATLVVKLKNGGFSGYQQDVYGESIIVERHFSKAGASGFKLKTSSGRVISTKKADLEEICDYFALQIDNPMNVLTQDMARQFLNNSSPTEKYKFFVKGVQLEQLDQDYQLLEETIDNIESRLGTRIDDIKVLEERARKAANRLAMSDKHESLREKIRSYGRQMAWAQVEQQEQVLANYISAVEEAERVIEAAEAKARTVEQTFDDADRTCTETTAALQEIKNGLAPLQDERNQVKDQFDKNKDELLSVQTDQRSIKDHLRAAEARINAAKDDIDTEKQRLEDLNGGSHTRKREEIETAKEAANEARVQYDLQVNDTSRLEDDFRMAKEMVEEHKVPLETKRAEYQQCKNQLDSLVRDRGQQHGAFHENMPTLLRAIGQESGFQNKPVGPIGNHVRLLKPVWSSILERSFGQTLTSFIVTSKQDQTLLSRIMQRVQCKCPILIGNRQSIDTSQHEPDPKFDTSLRVLEIDNDLVKRQLIINQAIEQTVLIQDRHEANRAMFDGARLRNVKQCFCLHEERRGHGLRLGYSRNGEPSTSPMPPIQGKPRMKTDIESQINYQRENLSFIKNDQNELEKRLRELQADAAKCQQAIVRHKRQVKDAQLQVQRAEEAVERLQDELDKDSVEDGRLDALEAHLKEAKEEKALMEGSYEESVNAKDKLNDKSKGLREQLQAMDVSISEIAAKAKEADKVAQKAASVRLAALHGKNTVLQDIEDAKDEKVRKERERDRQAEKVEEFASKASAVSARVPIEPGETPNSLDKKLDKLTKDLDRFTREIGGTRESIAQEAAETQLAYEAAKQQVEDLEQLAQMLKFALIERQERWRKFRRYISARARAQFTYLLSERSFRGALKTDHRHGILDLHVEPDETKTGKGRQTKTLSGGEKSFSTICLLLSLWEAMGSPIRCLDEFDVFMDNVNRDVSMKMMIIAARRSVGRQYILITPQSMGNVDVAEDVKIIKLSDPERGQTTLPFAAAH